MSGDRRLALLRLHQREASLDARERLAAVAGLAPGGPDLVPLLTCHRVEVYALVPASAEPRDAFASRLGSDLLALAEASCLCDEDAAEHLFRVTAGLDSAIVGEGQIASQVRRTYDASRTAGLDGILAALFQRALHFSRTLRMGSELGSVRRSIGSLAVDEALRRFEDPARVTALVVGAGEIGKLAARALRQRVGRLIVANRDPSRAEAVASAIGAEGVGLDALDASLARADAVISAADTRGAVLTRDLLARRCSARPLVLVDIAVPRSVAEDARDLPGLVYRDVDHLAASAAAVPPAAVADGEHRCSEEAAAFVAWLRGREAVRTIRQVRERAATIRERQLGRALRRLGHLSDRDRRSVRALASSLTNAILHEPTVRLRSSPELEASARALFALDR